MRALSVYDLMASGSPRLRYQARSQFSSVTCNLINEYQIRSEDQIKHLLARQSSGHQAARYASILRVVPEKRLQEVPAPLVIHLSSVSSFSSAAFVTLHQSEP